MVYALCRQLQSLGDTLVNKLLDNYVYAEVDESDT
jgi:hypothetical protein